MTKFSTALMCACFALSGASAFAQDTTTTHKDTMGKNHMTAAKCKDHNERIAKGEYKQDPASEKMDRECQEILKGSTTMKK